MHGCRLLKTLNALNAYEINLLQVLPFIHKIKTNSSPPNLPTSVSNNKSYICNSVLQEEFQRAKERD